MIRAFIKSPQKVARMSFGPLAPYLDNFAKILKENLYSRGGGQRILGVVGEFNYFMHVRHLNVKDITVCVIDEFINEQKEISLREGLDRHTNLFVRYLVDAKIIQDPYLSVSQARKIKDIELVITEYGDYMTNVRGLSRHHIICSQRVILSFLQSLFPNFQRKMLHQITPKMIIAYCSDSETISLRKIQCIHVFCKYLYGQGIINKLPASLFSGPPKFRLKNPPKSLSQDDVLKIVAAADSDSPIDVRNRAIIIFLVTLGVRSCEISNLKFEDIDWKEGIIHIRKAKNTKERTLPLSEHLGKAIEDYILWARPTYDSPYVFLKQRAPVGPLKSRAALRHVIERLAQKANVGLPKHINGPFRHSLASLLVNSGTPIKTISDLLGHQSIDTTAIYTLVDFSSLTKVVTPLPKGI